MLADELYIEWADAPEDKLGGCSPKEWFAQMDTPEKLISTLSEYVSAKVEVPELLLDRFGALGDACVFPLEAILLDTEQSDIQRCQVLKLLLEIAPESARTLAVPIVLNAQEAGVLADCAAEALSEQLEASARESLIVGLENASKFGKTLILEILCNFPEDFRIYNIIRDILVNRPERRAFAAKLMGRLGDPRGIEPLTQLLSLSDLTYFEYMEIHNAIEALGGEVAAEREFYGDPDYEYMRNLE